MDYIHLSIFLRYVRQMHSARIPVVHNFGIVSKKIADTLFEEFEEKEEVLQDPLSFSGICRPLPDSRFRNTSALISPHTKWETVRVYFIEFHSGL